MQPYFFPYIGYFQLIHSADKFIIYDTVNYIKNGWIKRNRYLHHDTIRYFSLSIQGASSHKLINNTYIAEEEQLHSKERIVKTIHMAYSKAPYFDNVISLLDGLILNEEQNIALFNTHILREVCQYLRIDTEIHLGSEVLSQSSLTGHNRVVEICEEFNAEEYHNPIGGMAMYDREIFKAHGIDLFFIKTSTKLTYRQWDDTFYPNLSIIDLLMFNSREEIINLLNQYTLIQN